MHSPNSNLKPGYKKPSSFAEALLEIGGQNPTQETNKNSDKHIEHAWKNQLRIERHKEVVSTPIFSREQEEIAKKIEEVKAELKKLAEEIVLIGSEIDKVVQEQVVNPGTYHVSFFESLRRYLLQLRKKTVESRDWLAISQQRKQSQNHYWGSVKKSGTSFMLSSERTSATQSG